MAWLAADDPRFVTELARATVEAVRSPAYPQLGRRPAPLRRDPPRWAQVLSRHLGAGFHHDLLQRVRLTARGPGTPLADPAAENGEAARPLQKGPASLPTPSPTTSTRTARPSFSPVPTRRVMTRGRARA